MIGLPEACLVMLDRELPHMALTYTIVELRVETTNFVSVEVDLDEVECSSESAHICIITQCVRGDTCTISCRGRLPQKLHTFLNEIQLQSGPPIFLGIPSLFAVPVASLQAQPWDLNNRQSKKDLSPLFSEKISPNIIVISPPLQSSDNSFSSLYCNWVSRIDLRLSHPCPLFVPNHVT